ncbi:MAG: nodulation protein NfeD [Chloroflexi bacterium]|nr:nodulation protein NfeD [Chloroflexota bacterium]
MLNIAIRLVSLVAMVLGLAGAVAGVASGADAKPVLVGHITGVINPITARYVDRLVTEGEQRAAAAVVFVIDTPGGLIDSTYLITGRFLNARVPVVTYVGPSGARAASAGTFITMAGHIAAMAPATNIGAAHPVDSSGSDIQGDLRLKAENDATAQITKIAVARGRNEKWAEEAVRKSVSIRDDEALRINVVDVVAADVPTLLAKIDGREVTLLQGRAKLATAGAPVEAGDPSPFETLLHLIVDPQIAVLLFTVGTYGIIFELSNPGLIFPGIVGVIAIVLALFAFGTLDANAAGIALMVFAVLLFVAEIKVVSHGLLTAGGVAALIVGTIVVFPPGRPTFPGLRASVDPIVIAFVVALTLLFFGVAVRSALRFIRLPVASGREILVGAVGVAKSDVAPTGIVRVADDEWSAVSSGGPIARGSAVRVQRVDGIRLIVEPTRPRGKEEGL